MTEPYRILVTGSRTWTDRQTIHEALLERLFFGPADGFVVVHGACPAGADAIADAFARDLVGDQDDWVSVETHPADWSQGKGAGFARNQAMVDLGADVCLAFIRDNSRGATHCMTRAEAAGIPTKVYRA